MSKTKQVPYGKQRFLNKLLWRIILIIGFVMTGLGLSNIVSEMIVSLGIEFISATNAGMTVNGVWVMVAALVAEFVTDKLFRDAPNFLTPPE